MSRKPLLFLRSFFHKKTPKHTMSRRKSFASPGLALRDSSSRYNYGRSSGTKRITLDDDDDDDNTPLKGRSSVLVDWRSRQEGGKSRSREKEERGSESKRVRTQPPRLPPSHNSKFTTAGTSSLERIRRLKENRKIGYGPGDDSFLSSQDESDDSYHNKTTSFLLTATPSRGLGGGAARRKSISGLSMNSKASQDTIHMSQSSQLSELSEDPQVDPVEGAGLRSRIRELQQRLQQAEKEKLELQMSKAPLVNRLQENEDAWAKEQARFRHEIESLRESGRLSDELNKDLEVKCEALEEESRHLRLELRKASSSLNANSTASISFSTGDDGWDRQLQCDREVIELKEKLRHCEEEIESIKLVKVSVEKELHATKIELECVLRNFDELQQEYEEIARSTSDNKDAELQLEALTTEHIATSAQLNAACTDLAATKARAEAEMEEKDLSHKKEVDQLHFEMSVLKTRAGKIEEKTDSFLECDVEDDAVLIARIEERDRRIAELESQLLKSEQQRRKMHNCIQELRGNIRVYVRTRPFLPSDKAMEVSAIDVSPDGESLSIVDKRNEAEHDFKFDKVFAPSSGQDMIFKEVADFVQSALDGYHVCLFSYGQTGSGKTHTMQGSGNAAMRGIIPRAVELILEQAKAMRSQKWDFTLSASFLEIYNEELKDLLVSMKNSKPVKLSIKRSREGKSFVDGLVEVPINTIDALTGMEQLEKVMSVAARSRSVACTKMNSQSSRSHSVFILHLRGVNSESGAIVQGALNLCDLAGSERLDRSGAGADSQRLRETQAINKSLSCLGDVFNALAQRAAHVPYRNSKLTYLLQDCLSGDGKALMFVNLSPTVASSNESLCSLRFAQRVNQVELGKPTKNIQYNKKK